jgi:Ran-binding protein 3
MAHHKTDTKHLEPSPPASDNEGGEKPVREQLKKTSIDTDKTTDKIPSIAVATSSSSSSSSSSAAANDADLRHKRSIEDVERDASEDENGHISLGRHGRKRSRDLAENSSEEVLSTYEASGAKSDASSEVDNRPGTPVGNRGSSGDFRPVAGRSDRVTSPKGKRNIEQFLRDDDTHAQSLNGAAIASASTKDVSKATGSLNSQDDERDAKRYREEEIKSTGSSQTSRIGDNKDPVKVCIFMKPTR